MNSRILKILPVLLMHLSLVQTAWSQNTFRAVLTDSVTGEKLYGASVILMNSTNGSISDSTGTAEIKNLPDGDHTFQAGFIGYRKKSVTLHFPMATSEPYKISMAPEEQMVEQVIVTSTRTNSRIEDAPVKAEVLGIDDLEEESSLQPGNVAGLIGDVSGVQIQQTSAVSGNSVIRMQGLDGRYTLLLRDGFPDYGSLSGGLNVLQILPLDLRQIEIIKGPASTIDGGGAIAGLINFVSKEPSDSTEATFVVNQSSLLENNLDAYVSGRSGKMGYTLFAGGTHQFARDVNGDGFSDVPRTWSALVHPQLFFYPNDKTQIRWGLIANYDNRMGGDMKVINGGADSIHQYYERNIMQSYGSDLMIKSQLPKNQSISFKASANYLNRKFSTNEAEFAGGQWNGFSEFYYKITSGRDNFIVGLNYLLDLYRHKPGDTSQFLNHTYHTIGLFAQYNYIISEKLNLQLGLRGDYQSTYGFFVLPSAAILVHANKEFSVRINGGSGYVIPDLLDFAGLNENITSYIASGKLLNEYSFGGTAEWNYHKLFPDKGLSLFINQTFFYTYVENAIVDYYNSSGTDSIYNTAKGAVSMGVDNYIRMTRDPIEVYLGYTFTYPRKNADVSQPWLTLTPLNRASAVITAKAGKHLKLGLEGSVIGREYLDNGNRTKPYFLLSASVQYHIKKVTLVLNGENLLNIRQQHFGPVVYPPYTHPTFAQIWAPVEGAVVNFSIMIKI